MFDKILIANRGEIAVRIIRTCRRMGIKTVAVYSEADMRSVYVKETDESVFIGNAFAGESYLNAEKIINAALNYKCQAIHPGYGFLSENASFAQKVADAGLIFIGPSAKAIAAIGDKTASKSLAMRIGIPVVPGTYEPLRDIESILNISEKMGFPLLLKPAAGGGGRGMRIVYSREELAPAFTACKEEIRKSFKDDRIFIERYIIKPRHIEFQIMADNYGNIVHFGERECSIQRRHQKVIEESPSVVLDEKLRNKMGKLACSLAMEAGYTNAGTAEFILDEDKNFYFLEMNTRLQVEHPITELITSTDLVELQLKIAAGESLSIKQEDIQFKGWAIEARICAEDPYRNFLPTTGMVTRYAMPKGKNVRVDSGIDAGSIITIYYDSLLAKVAAWGETRQEAIQTLIRALNGYHIEGLTTNVDFTNTIITHPAFGKGELSTNFIEEHFINGESKNPPVSEHLDYMIIAAVLVYHARQQLVKESLKPMSPLIGGIPYIKKEYSYTIKADKSVSEVKLSISEDRFQMRFFVNDKAYEVIAPEMEYYRRRLNLKINGNSHMFRMNYENNRLRVNFCGIIRLFEIFSLREWELDQYMQRDIKAVQENILKCPMPGLITAICIKEGARVHKGQEVIRMESMKMETGIASSCDCYVEKILVSPGQTVDTNETLLILRF